MLSKKRFVSTGWEPKTKTKSIHFIAFLLAERRVKVLALVGRPFCWAVVPALTVHALARCYHGVLAYAFGQDFPNGPPVSRVPALGDSFVSVPFKPAFMSAQVEQPREGTMRDIRGDLQERAVIVDEQIRAAAAHSDKAIQRLPNGTGCEDS